MVPLRNLFTLNDLPAPVWPAGHTHYYLPPFTIARSQYRCIFDHFNAGTVELQIHFGHEIVVFGFEQLAGWKAFVFFHEQLTHMAVVQAGRQLVYDGVVGRIRGLGARGGAEAGSSSVQDGAVWSTLLGFNTMDGGDR